VYSLYIVNALLFAVGAAVWMGLRVQCYGCVCRASLLRRIASIWTRFIFGATATV